ncbi:MAG: hypothetical protein AB1403_10730 [Candidatus Riflebacteria bacterium]
MLEALIKWFKSLFSGENGEESQAQQRNRLDRIEKGYVVDDDGEIAINIPGRGAQLLMVWKKAGPKKAAWSFIYKGKELKLNGLKPGEIIKKSPHLLASEHKEVSIDSRDCLSFSYLTSQNDGFSVTTTTHSLIFDLVNMTVEAGETAQKVSGGDIWD